MKSTTTRIQDIWMKRLVIVGGTLLLALMLINVSYWVYIVATTLGTSNFNDPMAWRSIAAFAGVLPLSVASTAIGMALGYFGSRSQRKLVRAARAVTLGLIGFGLHTLTYVLYVVISNIIGPYVIYWGFLPVQITQFWPQFLAIACTVAVSVFYLRTVASGAIRHKFISALGWTLAVVSSVASSFSVLDRLFDEANLGMALSGTVFILAIVAIGCVLTYLLVARRSELREHRWDSMWMMAMMIAVALGMTSFSIWGSLTRLLFAVAFVVLPLATWLAFVWPWLNKRYKGLSPEI